MIIFQNETVITIVSGFKLYGYIQTRPSPTAAIRYLPRLWLFRSFSV